MRWGPLPWSAEREDSSGVVYSISVAECALSPYVPRL